MTHKVSGVNACIPIIFSLQQNLILCLYLEYLFNSIPSLYTYQSNHFGQYIKDQPFWPKNIYILFFQNKHYFFTLQ